MRAIGTQITALLAAALLVAGCGGGGGGDRSGSGDRSTPSDVTANEFVSVEAGEYTVGDDTWINWPAKQYKVDAFEIQKYEVTNQQYKQWLDTLSEEERAEHMPKKHFTGKGVWKDGWYPEGEHNHPVANIRYRSAQAYAKAKGWDLPTRVQWEAAARGPEARNYPWGDEFDPAKANAAVVGGSTKPVGSYPAGASWCGALDLCGNVWEITKTPWDERKRQVVAKGGSFLDTEPEIVAAHNQWALELSGSDSSGPNFGFRCVRE